MNTQTEPSTVITLGARVRVRRESNLLCGSRYPGRTGIVTAENPFGRDNGGLWYVRLDATQRANKIWKKQLAGYQAPAIDPAVDEALQAYIATRKASMPDASY